MDNCRICDKPLPAIKHNRQVYCGKGCQTIAKNTKNRVAQQKKVYDRMMKGAECARCLKVVHEVGMRKYCKECSKLMSNKKICIECGKEHKREKTDRCQKCATARAKKMSKDYNTKKREVATKHRQPCRGCGCKLGDDIPPQNRYCSDECKEVSKPKKQSPSAPKNPKKKDKPEINPFFLTRGTPSRNSNGNSMDSGFTG